MQRTHSGTAGEAATGAVAQQLEVWAIDEMVDATEAAAGGGRGRAAQQQEAAEERTQQQGQASAHWRGQGECAWCEECEWCEEEAAGGRVQPNEPGV